MFNMVNREIFENILPSECILDSVEDLEFYGSDWCKDFTGKPSLILLPTSPEIVGNILKTCTALGISIVPSGGRTGLSGGATAMNGEVVLSLSKMNKIIDIDPLGMTLTCEAGAVTQSVIDAAAQKGLYFPIQFGSRGSSQIGGNVSTNVGGIRVIKYGGMREWVIGIKVVLASGEILNINGPLYKIQAGYDLRGLFIGAEGTLGIITEVTLKLTLPPVPSLLFAISFDKLDSAHLVLAELRKKALTISLYEYFDQLAFQSVLKFNQDLTKPFSSEKKYYALVEVDLVKNNDADLASELFTAMHEEGVIQDVIVTKNEKEYNNIIQIRERIGETFSTKFLVHKNDVSVPVPKVPALINGVDQIIKNTASEVQISTFGHIGDGNVHINTVTSKNNNRDEFFKICHDIDNNVFQLVNSLGGSISAEHGIGLLKREFLGLTRSDSEISMMKEIKKVFDPKGILNPQKIFIN